MPRANIPFPIKGLSENWAFDQQEPGTTRDLLNVRAIDPVTGRTRGAQRSGTSRFLDDALGVVDGANSKIQDIVGVNNVNSLLDWSTNAPPTTDFTKPFEHPPANPIGGVDIAKDDFGNLYVLQKEWRVLKYNQDGGLQLTIDIPSALQGLPGLSAVHVDEAQNVYVTRGSINPSDNQANCRVHAFQFQQDGTYAVAWTLDTTRRVFDVSTNLRTDGRKDMFLLEADLDTEEKGYFTVWPDISLTGDAPTEDTDRRVELDDTSGSNAENVVVPGRMAKCADGCFVIVGASGLTSSTEVDTRLWKVDPYGDTPSVIVDEVSGIGGIGLGVAIGPTNADGEPTIYTCGPDGDLASGESSADVRRIVDKGATLDASGTGSWAWEYTPPTGDPTADYDMSLSGGSGESRRRLRMAVDTDDNVYVPSPDDSIVVFAPDPESGADPEELTVVEGELLEPLAVAVSGTKPVGFPDGDSGSGIEEAEFVYVVNERASGENRSFARFRVASVSQSAGTFRDSTLLALGGGVVEKFSAGGAFSDPAGGTGVGVLDEDSPYVQSIVSIAKLDPDDDTKARFRVYITDGANYRKYDPEDDAVTDWTSSSQGSIPSRCRLLELWQGRAVLARDPESPAAWHMSAINNPEDWDNFPQNINAGQAISGSNSRAGDCPDVVNSMLPWDDDLLLFGGDRSLWRLTGNPMTGGQFDLISDQTGMAFGRPWCKEPGGQVVYFMSSECGVFALQRGGGLTRLSRDRIERRLQDSVDFSTHYVRLAWNHRDEGFHVFQMPYGSGGTIVKHWFWDRKNDAWFEDQFGTSSDTGKQPTAAFTFNGDAPEDRVLLLGCEDGRVRAWDEDALSDDYSSATDRGAGGGTDVAIDSYVSIGPIQPRDIGVETQFTELRAWMARDQDGVNVSFYADYEPDFSIDAPVAQVKLSGGANGTKLVRFRGDTAFVRLRNANDTQRWALERLTINYDAAGEKRLR